MIICNIELRNRVLKEKMYFRIGGGESSLANHPDPILALGYFFTKK